MQKIVSVLARLLLAQIYLVSIIIQLLMITQRPDGYAAYQGYLAHFGLGTLFAPLMILIQLVGGALLLLGFKTRFAAILLAVYSVFVAFVLKWQDPIGFMQYLAITGGMLLLALHPKTAFSLDGLRDK